MSVVNSTQSAKIGGKAARERLSRSLSHYRSCQVSPQKPNDRGFDPPIMPGSLGGIRLQATNENRIASERAREQPARTRSFFKRSIAVERKEKRREEKRREEKRREERRGFALSRGGNKSGWLGKGSLGQRRRGEQRLQASPLPSNLPSPACYPHQKTRKETVHFDVPVRVLKMI